MRRFYLLAPAGLEGPYDTFDQAKEAQRGRGLEVAVDVPPGACNVEAVRVVGLREVTELGLCDDCRSVVLSCDAYESATVGRQLVYGRIGFPSGEITGVTRGTKVIRCEACVREHGPIR